jgi:hypothetical protein
MKLLFGCFARVQVLRCENANHRRRILLERGRCRSCPIAHELHEAGIPNLWNSQARPARRIRAVLASGKLDLIQCTEVAEKPR